MKKISLFICLIFCCFIAQIGHAQISVTATAGTTGPTVYSTLHAAVVAINAGTHQGNIKISVTASTTETLLSTINASGTGAANYTHITIKPAASATPTISGNITTGILYINASNVTVDGSNTVGGTTRDLTITNSNTTAGGLNYVIRLAPPSATVGATSDTIENCSLALTSSSSCFAVICAASNTATIYNQAEAASSNNTIMNNAITGAQEGIYINGATAGDNQWSITGNSISGLGFDGILLYHAANFTITNNTITNVSINGGSAVTGMNFSWVLTNGNISGNNINAISNTLSNGCYGMYFDLDPASSGVNVYNNFISNVISRASTTLYLNGFGIYMDYGAGLNLYENTIDLTTNQTGTTANGKTAAMCFDQQYLGISLSAVTIKDNILANNQTAGNRYGIYSSAANSIFTSIDYNDYYAVSGNLGYLTSARTTIAQMQTGFGGNLNSITPYNPAFVSTTDLHLTPIAANNVLIAGTPMAATDIDGTTRSTTTPTIGAHELAGNKITYTTLANTCSTGDITLVLDTITSSAGVPTSGATVPQIYFRKNALAWNHASGTLTTGTATNGNWTFTISAATMGGVTGGDVISYYVIAQTTGGTVFANPSAGLVATDVNTVTTPPSTPNTYTVTAVSLTGLTSAQSLCYNSGAAQTVSYAYAGAAGSPDQYTLTWSPAGPVAVSSFSALPVSPLTVSVPAGTAANTYTGTLTIKNATTGCTNTYSLSLTVNPTPAAITGGPHVCSGGSSITLGTTPAGGTWSSVNTAVATITTPGGVLTGHNSGTSTISYIMPVTGCFNTVTITVDSTPTAAISGTTSFCSGGSASLTVTGTANATVYYTGPSGAASVVLNAAGTATIATGTLTTGTTATVNTYTLTSATLGSCSQSITGSATVTVNPVPTAITGTNVVCEGATILMGSTPTGGTWTSSPTTSATVGSSSGIVTGVVGGAGPATITYTLTGGCYVTRPITVLALPSPITGASAVCVASTITLSTSTGVGTWAGSDGAVASVNPSNGAVTGNSSGTVTVSYTSPTGCIASTLVTVNALPGPISGPAAVCSLSAVTMTDTSVAGTWSAAPAGTATIVPTSGVLTGGAAGTATITFTKTATGCFTTSSIIVNALPSAITGTTTLCAGSTSTLADASTPGTWSASAVPGYVTVGSSNGVLSGVSAGTQPVTFTNTATGCQVSTSVTVNPLPAAIGGPTAVCANGVASAITLTDASTPGTWSTTGSYASVNAASGLVSGLNAGSGTQIITYTLTTTGCKTTATITVNPQPAAIGGTPVVCAGQTTVLTDGTSGGTWSPLSGGSTVATAASATDGTITGLAAGTQVISYTLSTGCAVGVSVLVNALPSNITGTPVVCQQASITLSDISTPGSWSVASGSTIAAVNPSTGVVTGGTTAGTETVTYTLNATGCYTTVPVLVNAIPQPITGSTFALCANGSSTVLHDASPSGVWASSASSAVATISSGGLVIAGTTAGTTTISYTFPTTNCYVTAPFTINQLPSLISGSLVVCQGSTTSLGSSPAGGTWTTTVTTPMIATINSSGVATGVNGGTTGVMYTLPTGCNVTANLLVNAQPSIITGVTNVCAGGLSTTTLHDSTAGGTWSVSPAVTASIDPVTGVVTGGVAGTAIVTYTTSTTNCTETIPVTVVPLIPPTVSITASTPTTICAGTPVTYSATATNAGTSPLYVWSINGVITSGGAVFNYTPANGDVVKCWILSSYTCAVPDSASASITMTVNPVFAPSVDISTGMGDTVCTGMLATFTAIPSGGGTSPVYQWWINYAPVSAATAYSYTPNNGDIISVTMHSNYTCRTADSATHTTVISVVNNLLPSVTITNNAFGAISCEGQEVTYVATPVVGGYTPAYAWTVNGLPVGSSANTFSYTPSNGDVIAVTMTSSFPCVATPIATNSMTMTVLPIEFAVSTVTAHPGYILTPTMADTFVCTIISGGGLAPGYQWYRNGVPVAGATNNTWAVPGGYLHNYDSIACQVVNTDLCSGISSFEWMHLTVDPNANVGVQTIAGNEAVVNVMPNPTNGVFAIKGSLGAGVDESVTIEITDMLGRVVYTAETPAVNGVLEARIVMSSNVGGVYLLNVHSAHVSKVFHIVLEH